MNEDDKKFMELVEKADGIIRNSDLYQIAYGDAGDCSVQSWHLSIEIIKAMLPFINH
jgi:hypothetical protein